MFSTDDPKLAAIAAELDQAHERARVAFRARDLSTYMSGFSNDLVYRDVKGRVTSHQKLTHQVRDQFDQLVAADTRFERNELTLDGEYAVEIGTQTARAAVSILFIFARKWRIHRKARGTWRRTSEGWVICAVDVLEERITGDGCGLANPNMFSDTFRS